MLAYPQADIENTLYIKFPYGIKTSKGSAKSHVLKLKQNLYGQKQAGLVWYNHLTSRLKRVGFKQSAIDDCVFYKGNVIFFFYVDDGIFVSPDSKEVDKVIKELKDPAIGLDLEDQGDIADYLGINFNYGKDVTIIMSQPQLIDQIIEDVFKFKRNKNLPDIPALSTCILQRDEKTHPFKGDFHYRSIIGKLTYLEKGTRPDIGYATHQLARFCEDPKASHGKAVEHLVKYLIATRHKGLILTPIKTKSVEVYADADFSGNRNKLTAEHDPSTTKSRTGYLAMYAGCPIIWKSVLQTQVSLSITDAEYISLSQSLREIIPVINLLNELKEINFAPVSIVPAVYCKAFEDNSGTLELAKTPRLRPRTKHINIVYHHFREHVRKRIIQLFPVSTTDQLADIFTKPLSVLLCIKFRKEIMGW